MQAFVFILTVGKERIRGFSLPSLFEQQTLPLLI